MITMNTFTILQARIKGRIQTLNPLPSPLDVESPLYTESRAITLFSEQDGLRGREGLSGQEYETTSFNWIRAFAGHQKSANIRTRRTPASLEDSGNHGERPI
jgi:hypothetical protein